ncbi:MAG: ABC transporter ATP-binding protein [Pseudomonadota bacterium]
MSSLTNILSVHLRPLWKSYIYAIFFIVITAWIAVKIPELVSRAVNGHLDATYTIPLSVMVLGFIQIVVRTCSRLFVFNPAREMEEGLKNQIFSKLMRATLPWLQTRQTGDLQSLINSDTGHLRVFIGLGGLQVASFLTLAVFAISKMITIHATLTFVTLLPLLLAVPLLRLGMPKVMKLNVEQTKLLGSLTSRITEAFVNVHMIQSTASESSFIGRIAERSDELRILNMRLLRIRLLIFPVLPLLTGVSSFLVFLYGGYEAISGRLTAGDIIAFTSYVTLLAFPLGIIGMVLAMWQRAEAASKRIEVALLAESEKDSGAELKDIAPSLEIRNLDFRFSEEHKLLTGVSFRVDSGEVLGIAGPIGAGKTTLLNLTSSLIQPPPNTIFVGGFDVTQWNAAQLRRMVGLVPQTPQLFSVSIRENLTAGLNPEESDIWKALDLACIRQDIEALPEGLETPIGERGIRLSGGQKQRLALARQLLRETPILLLDDVISAVDQITEERILAGLRATKRAVVLVTHRESALLNCDRVLRLGGAHEIA